MIGQNLSHYRIEEELGKGGMGVVYRATDSKLGREVAIKVLPESFAHDPERLARFEREARMVAALNHPNIAAIHGIEEDQGTRFLVLELVPGKNLKGPLPVEEALRIGRQMAEALEAAHEKGMIHRDLKPANIKITPEGKVKLLDFGLAKRVELSSSDSTLTVETAPEGAVMGTVGYMSPEQARGAPTDKRTDIWAFGCVLYEMLAGRKAFPGKTISDFIATVLTGEPDWAALPEATPQHVRMLLRRCLQKDRNQRLRDIGDARLELEAPLDSATAVVATAPWGQPVLIGVACLALGAVTAGIGSWALWRQTPTSKPVARFTISLPPKEIVHPIGRPSVAVSPDGTRLAFVGFNGSRTQIYLRYLDQLESRPVSGTLGGNSPFFSPDGEWLGFRHQLSRTLKKVALSGGAPVTIGPAEAGSGSNWERDDTIVSSVQTPGAILRVPSAGGTPQPLTQLDSRKEDKGHYWPELLPGGKAVLFSSVRLGIDSYDDARIEVQVLATGERRVMVEGGSCARYSSTGHLIYARAGALLAVPFDLSRLAVSGSPIPVLEGLSMGLNTPTAHFSLATNGTLVYAPGPAVGGERNVVWVDRQGTAERLPIPPRMYLHPRISPDGRQIAIEIEGPVHDFYNYEIGRGVLTKMTLTGSSHWPLWTPDGKRLTYRRWFPGGFTMWWMPVDRSAESERLTTIGIMQSASDWTPDGKVVAFTQTSPETGPDVYVLPIEDRERKPIPFAQTRFAEGSPKVSPDGRWIAYTSNESGRNEIYVQLYPGPGPKIQVSTDGGIDAAWRRNGGELFYRNGDKMMVVSVTTRPTFIASTPRMLWEGRYAQGTSSACGPPGPTSSNYDVTPDGQRFLMIKDSDTESFPTQINVVLNWSEELKRLTSEGRKRP